MNSPLIIPREDRAILRSDDPRDDALLDLLNAYISSDPRLQIWANYPDITEAQDEQTDTWACEQVSAEFAAFARALGWDASVVRADEPEATMAFEHAWVRVTRDGVTTDVDWTARQFHNLFVEGGHDPAVLALPWPLAWAPAAIAPEHHPIVGTYAALTLEDH
jgi:hypothetical protein